MVLMSGSSSCLAGDGFCCFWDNTTATLIKTICKLKFLNKNHTYCAILKCTEKEADGNHCCGSTGQYCMAVRKVEGDWWDDDKMASLLYSIPFHRCLSPLGQLSFRLHPFFFGGWGNITAIKPNLRALFSPTINLQISFLFHTIPAGSWYICSCSTSDHLSCEWCEWHDSAQKVITRCTTHCLGRLTSCRPRWLNDDGESVSWTPIDRRPQIFCVILFVSTTTNFHSHTSVPVVYHTTQPNMRNTRHQWQFDSENFSRPRRTSVIPRSLSPPFF